MRQCDNATANPHIMALLLSSSPFVQSPHWGAASALAHSWAFSGPFLALLGANFGLKVPVAHSWAF